MLERQSADTDPSPSLCTLPSGRPWKAPEAALTRSFHPSTPRMRARRCAARARRRTQCRQSRVLLHQDALLGTTTSTPSASSATVLTNMARRRSYREYPGCARARARACVCCLSVCLSVCLSGLSVCLWRRVYLPQPHIATLTLSFSYVLPNSPTPFYRPLQCGKYDEVQDAEAPTRPSRQGLHHRHRQADVPAEATHPALRDSEHRDGTNDYANLMAIMCVLPLPREDTLRVALLHCSSPMLGGQSTPSVFS